MNLHDTLVQWALWYSTRVVPIDYVDRERECIAVWLAGVGERLRYVG